MQRGGNHPPMRCTRGGTCKGGGKLTPPMGQHHTRKHAVVSQLTTWCGVFSSASQRQNSRIPHNVDKFWCHSVPIGGPEPMCLHVCRTWLETQYQAMLHDIKLGQQVGYNLFLLWLDVARVLLHEWHSQEQQHKHPQAPKGEGNTPMRCTSLL